MSKEGIFPSIFRQILIGVVSWISILSTSWLGLSAAWSAVPTEGIFIDYDCAFGSYSFDWNQIYKEIFDMYLNSSRQTMEIPPNVMRSVADILLKGKQECPLGAMQISLMLYYHTLRDYEVHMLRQLAIARRETIRLAQGGVSFEQMKNGQRPLEIFSMIPADFAELRKKRPMSAALKDTADLETDAGKASLHAAESEAELDVLLKPSDPLLHAIDMDKHSMSLKSVAAAEKHAKPIVKIEQYGGQFVALDPDMLRERLIEEFEREPKNAPAYFSLLKDFESAMERLGIPKLRLEKLSKEWPKEVDTFVTMCENAFNEPANEAGKDSVKRLLFFVKYLTKAVESSFNDNTETNLQVQSFKDQVGLALMSLQELREMEAGKDLYFDRRQHLFNSVFVYGKNAPGTPDYAEKSEAGYALKFQLRGNTTSPMRGTNYYQEMQLEDKYKDLTYIDNEFEWQLLEEMTKNRGSLDPDELVWEEIDTSSHIKQPPLYFRRLKPNIIEGFDHEGGLAEEAKRAKDLKDISMTQLSSALRFVTSDFMAKLAQHHPLFRQISMEVNYYAEIVQYLMQNYSVTILAESRWPIFEALNLYSWYHVVSKEYLCQNQGNSGLLPWSKVRTKTQEWAQVKTWKIRMPEDEEIDIINLELERFTAEVVQATLGSKKMHAQAEVECPLALMLVACIEIASAANRYTQYVPNFEAPVNMMFETLHWQRISGSGWPIWQTLVYYSDINKGEYLFSPDKKYMRQFSDLDLRDSEINLYDFDYNQFDDLLALKRASSISQWAGLVRGIVLKKFRTPGFQLRPIFLDIINAISQAMGFERLLDTDETTKKNPCGSYFEEHYVGLIQYIQTVQSLGDGADVERKTSMEKRLFDRVHGYDKLIKENLLARDHLEGLNVTDQFIQGNPSLIEFLFQREFGLECGWSGITDAECVQQLGCCIAAEDPRQPVPNGKSIKDPTSEELLEKKHGLQPNQSKKNWNSKEARFVEDDSAGDDRGMELRSNFLDGPRCVHPPSTGLVSQSNSGRIIHSPIGAFFNIDLEEGKSMVATSPYRHIMKAGRKLVLVTLLYGEGWIKVVPNMLNRIYNQLQIPFPMVMVSVGEDAYKTCSSMQEYQKLACWRPETASQVHRFTVIFFLLQLGIETLYFDMDTFALQDFVTPIIEYADKGSHDILFPQHPDGPCINIGLFYINPTISTLQWFHDFLEWYHSYPYEVDQRGLDALTYPNSTLKVSHQPHRVDKTLANPFWVDSLHTYIMMAQRGPWMGKHEDVKFMHWFSRPFHDKFPEIQLAYLAGECAWEEGLELVQAIKMVKKFPELAEANENFAAVEQFIKMMDMYKVEKVPEKPKCW